MGDVELSETTAQIVQAAVIRPGDALILRIDERMSPDAFQRYADQIREKVGERMPGVEVLVLGGVAEMAVYRPEASV